MKAADVLASHVRTGSATQSPWPFRVYAQTNVVREQYSAHVISAIQLFDELIRLNLGNVSAYQSARQTAWNWLMTYPIQNNAWAGYFEDVQIQSDTSNVNQLNAAETARYLMRHPELDPNWETHARGIIAWIERTFAASQYGANTIAEQMRLLPSDGKSHVPVRLRQCTALRADRRPGGQGEGVSLAQLGDVHVWLERGRDRRTEREQHLVDRRVWRLHQALHGEPRVGAGVGAAEPVASTALHVGGAQRSVLADRHHLSGVRRLRTGGAAAQLHSAERHRRRSPALGSQRSSPRRLDLQQRDRCPARPARSWARSSESAARC